MTRVLLAGAIVIWFSLVLPSPVSGYSTAVAELVGIHMAVMKARTPLGVNDAAAFASRVASALGGCSFTTSIDDVPEPIYAARLSLQIANHLAHRHSYPSLARQIMATTRTVYLAWPDPASVRLVAILDKQDAYLSSKVDGQWPPNTGDPAGLDKPQFRHVTNPSGPND